MRWNRNFIFWLNVICITFLESKLKSNSKCNWYRQMGEIFKKYDLLNIWNDNKLIFNLPGSNNTYASVQYIRIL